MALIHWPTLCHPYFTSGPRQVETVLDQQWPTGWLRGPSLNGPAADFLHTCSQLMACGHQDWALLGLLDPLLGTRLGGHREPRVLASAPITTFHSEKVAVLLLGHGEPDSEPTWSALVWPRKLL